MNAVGIFNIAGRVRARALSGAGLLLLALLVGCSSGVTAPEFDPQDPPITAWRPIEDLPLDVVIFETVFWEPRDTPSLRKLIRETDLVRGKRVLEIGTGTGLLSLCSLQAGAARVVATDVNLNAVHNARYNAERLGFTDRFDVRQVPLDDRRAFAVIRPDEKFDLLISNPPWVDREPDSIDEYALYDEGFLLLESLMDGLRDHLNPGGKAYLAYGAVSGIRMIEKLAAERGMETRVIDDDRNLDELPEEFLPGMLIEVTP